MRHPSSQNKIEQKEQIQHGDIFFPVKRYHTHLNNQFPFLSTHWHEEMEWTKIIRGHCYYQIGLTSYHVSEGDFLLIQPMMLHSINRYGHSNMESETFVFHLNFLGATTTDACSLNYVMPILQNELLLPILIKKEHPIYETLYLIFEQLLSCEENKLFGYELKLKALFYELFYLLFQSNSIISRKEHSTNTRNIEKIKTVLYYITQHYMDNITISKLAKQCFFSEYHFMRFFKKYIGMTCMEYVNHFRLEKAAKALEQKEDCIMEIAMSVGFHNLSYFYKLFKKKYGMTPKTFMDDKL